MFHSNRCASGVWRALSLFLAMASASAGETPMNRVDEAVAARFAALALECVHREYPNKIAHVMQRDEDAKPPRELHPVFFGCFDWHSSVHGHWLLVRLTRLFPESDFAAKAAAALDQSFTSDRVAGEVAYFAAEGRAAYERPYGLAWLLQLCAELREWDDPRAKAWLAALAPLEDVVAQRLRDWLPKLAYPIRTGEHSQTAFAFGLALDWARTAGEDALAQLIEDKTRAFHLNDRGCNLAFEPSGQDFLSPCLAVADLMRRVLDKQAFAAWLGRFVPEIPFEGGADWLPLGVTTDPSDGKLAHLDGVNLSRAWMLEGVAAGLPKGDPRLPALSAAAQAHRASGLAAVSDAHYEGGHWLGSFAVYLVTGRGLNGASPSP